MTLRHYPQINGASMAQVGLLHHWKIASYGDGAKQRAIAPHDDGAAVAQIALARILNNPRGSGSASPVATLASRARRILEVASSVRALQVSRDQRHTSRMSTTTAAIATRNDPEAPVKRRKRRTSPKIVEAVRLIASGAVATQKAAAERVGVSEQWLSTMLGREENRRLLDDECRKAIRSGKVRATARLLELLESPSSKTSFEASKFVLQTEGIGPPRDGTTVNINSEASGYIIFLGGPGEEPKRSEVGPNGGVVYGDKSQVIDVTPERVK